VKHEDASRRRIGVFFDAPGYGEYPFDHEDYVRAYHEVAAGIEARGARFCIVRSLSTFLGGNTFKGYWEFDGTTFARREEAIDLDLVYDKGYFVGDGRTKLLNDPEMNRICTDKRATIAMFPDLSPTTVEAADRAALERVLSGWETPMAVAKPVDGAEAKGVVIGSPADVLAADHEFPVIVQQYVDTSGGIPGILDGVGDLRTILVDGEVALTYARKAKEGTLISNVSKGGTEIEVLPERRPGEALDIAFAIDKAFAPLSKHRVFCVDCARDASGRWYVIELNSKPGLSVRDYGATYPHYQDLLMDALVSAANE
jgi:hypothetical protein